MIFGVKSGVTVISFKITPINCSCSKTSGGSCAINNNSTASFLAINDIDLRVKV